MKTIHDFGSKIGGARKDVWVKRGLCIEDTKNMTASEKEKYIKRDYIWPKPDTQIAIPMFLWIKKEIGFMRIQEAMREYESMKQLMN